MQKTLLIFYFTFALIFSDFVIPIIVDAEDNKSAELADASLPESTAALPELAANFPRIGRPTISLIVNVSVNKTVKGDFFVEQGDDGELFFKAGDLLDLKLKFSYDTIRVIGDEKFASLNAVRDISYTFDEKNLTVTILGKTTESKQTTIELYSLQSRPQNVYYPIETSAFINYGLAYSYADELGFQSFSGSNKVGARTGNVFFVSDSLYTKTRTSENFVRLNSSATYERRNDLQWFVVGDQFANSGGLGSSVNIGGIGFSKIYRVDPYFITQPMFDLRGITEFPSEAEIYMDGVLVGKHAIAPGSFELKNIYSYAGSHIVEVLLKDPFGNEQKLSYPLYFGGQLLRKGLHEYSYNAGFLREQYGTKNSEYGEPVFSAFHRYGITSSLNIGARAEASDGIYNVGMSSSFLLPRLGAFNVSAAGSSANGVNGSAGSLQHSYQAGNFSTNLMMRGYSRDYATITAVPSSSMNKYLTSISAGFRVEPIGSFSLGYSMSRTYDNLTARITSASYSRPLSRTASLFASASRTKTVDTVNAVYVGLNFTPGKNLRGSASVSAAGDTNTETVQLQKDTPFGEGYGYRASLNRSDTGASRSYSFNPAVQYNARYGTYGLNSVIQNSLGKTSGSYTLSALGAFVYAGGFFGASRPVSDSFSIVIVDDLPNAAVLNNGQEIGRTSSSGRMVVPTLSSYSQNQITLDVRNMPLDYSISGVNQKISPSVWSGSCVSFDVLKVGALTGTLIMQAGGKKLPLEYVDIMVSVGGRRVTFPTGKGGEFYIENSLSEEVKPGAIDRQSCRAILERRKTGGNVIQPGLYPATVEYEDARCEFTVTFPETDDAITDVGEVHCLSVNAL